MKNIVIIGDSFAACSSNIDIKAWRGWGDLRYAATHPVWPDIVADHYNYSLKLFGFIGKSWWFSYWQFEKWRQENPTEWKKTDLVIVVHTDFSRLNSSHSDVPNMLVTARSSPVKVRQALEQFYIHLHDTPFSKWAQQQFFKMLVKLCKNKKIINIPVKDYLLDEPAYRKCKAGVVVMKDLYTISLEEWVNPKHHLGVEDFRICHFSPQNHVVLANELINIVDNYKPGPTSFRPNMFHKAFIQ